MQALAGSIQRLPTARLKSHAPKNQTPSENTTPAKVVNISFGTNRNPASAIHRGPMVFMNVELGLKVKFSLSMKSGVSRQKNHAYTRAAKSRPGAIIKVW